MFAHILKLIIQNRFQFALTITSAFEIHWVMFFMLRCLLLPSPSSLLALNFKSAFSLQGFLGVKSSPARIYSRRYSFFPWNILLITIFDVPFPTETCLWMNFLAYLMAHSNISVIPINCKYYCNPPFVESFLKPPIKWRIKLTKEIQPFCSSSPIQFTPTILKSLNSPKNAFNTRKQKEKLTHWCFDNVAGVVSDFLPSSLMEASSIFSWTSRIFPWIVYSALRALLLLSPPLQFDPHSQIPHTVHQKDLS